MVGDAAPGGSSPTHGALVVVSAVAVTVLQGWWPAVPTVLLFAVAIRSGAGRPGGSSVGTVALCWGFVGLFTAAPLGLVWPIPQLVGLVMGGALLGRRRVVRPVWFGPGKPDRPARILAVAAIPLTTVALVAFIASGRTDLATATTGLESMPHWLLPFVGIGFVLANPTLEEVLFRGLLQSMVTEESRRPVVGVAVQGVAFGAVHLHGVPGGPLGMMMAAVWGTMLGVVRHRTGSIRLVWGVHVLANVAIYSTVVTLALRDGVL